MLALRQRTKVAINQRLNSVRQKRDIPITTTTLAQPQIPERAVLIDSMHARIRNADNDRLDALTTQRLHCLIDLPLTGVAQRLIEQVLPILHVNDRVALISVLVGRRKIHIQLALVSQLWAINAVERSQIADDCMAPFVGGVGVPGIRYVHIFWCY